MKQIKLCVALILLMMSSVAFAERQFEQSLVVLPNPASIEAKDGSFRLLNPKVTVGSESLLNMGKELARRFRTGSDLKVAKKASTGLFLVVNKKLERPESYRIEITSKRILVEGADEAGVFYGVQSLNQLMNASVTGNLPAIVIEDAPRYSWRGFMVDESRHFFGKEKIKQVLNLMSYYKLNKFHWHLTDESGWRIEIKKYPLLTEVGSIGSWSNPNAPAQYYTQEDIKEIVAFAAERHIEVIPEIDMPGHATAANRAYPQYSGGGTKEHPDFTFNPGKEEVYSFLTDILKEVSTLFPSKYMHIGGDEVSFGIKAWESDPAVQALMKREQLKEVKEAERYFIYRMTDTVNHMGRELVGWDELLELNTDPKRTTIMWWRHDRVNQLKKALDNGYPTVLCPRRPLYFDFIQDASHKWGRTWNGFCPLVDVYNFPDNNMEEWKLTAPQLTYIKGIQGNLWTERIQNMERFDYMSFPRMMALAEAAWSQPQRKSFKDFEERLEQTYHLLNAIGVYYYDHRAPQTTPEPEGCTQGIKEKPMDFRD